MAAPRVARVGVVGGGPCGSAAATMLRAMGLSVKLFDKGRAIGGRASTCLAGETEPALRFDHGAQFLRATNPSFKRLLLSPLANDLFVPWSGRFGLLGRNGGLLPIEAVRNAMGGTGLLKDRGARATSAEDGPAEYGHDGAEDEDDEEASSSLSKIDFCDFLQRSEETLFVSAPGVASPWAELCKRTEVEVASSTTVLGATRSQPGSADGLPSWQVTSQGPNAASEPLVEEFDHLVLATHSSELPAAVLGGLLQTSVPTEMEPFLPALTELVRFSTRTRRIALPNLD